MYSKELPGYGSMTVYILGTTVGGFAAGFFQQANVWVLRRMVRSAVKEKISVQMRQIAEGFKKKNNGEESGQMKALFRGLAHKNAPDGELRNFSEALANTASGSKVRQAQIQHQPLELESVDEQLREIRIDSPRAVKLERNENCEED